MSAHRVKMSRPNETPFAAPGRKRARVPGLVTEWHLCVEVSHRYRRARGHPSRSGLNAMPWMVMTFDEDGGLRRAYRPASRRRRRLASI